MGATTFFNILSWTTQSSLSCGILIV